jgi:hypothetical protein
MRTVSRQTIWAKAAEAECVFKAPIHEQRQPARVVEMTVGEDRGAEVGRRKVKGITIALFVLVASLNNSAVD